jgi:hypothetical protein
MKGDGRDWVGELVIDGRYDLADGKCSWTKKYVGKHDVFYEGYNEGKGIWGSWEIAARVRLHGGFHIWPEGMGDPSDDHLVEEAEPPAPEEERMEVGITNSGKGVR